jgi:hypothetical protein
MLLLRRLLLLLRRLLLLLRRLRLLLLLLLPRLGRCRSSGELREAQVLQLLL